MRVTLPENGYESPGGSDTPINTFHGNGTNGHGERKRAGVSGSHYEGGQIGLDDPQSEAYVNSRLRDHAETGDTEELKKVGIRDRISLYTWTWFTMTMATGGIANVLHGSK